MAILTNDFLTNAVLINAVLTNGFLTNGKTPFAYDSHFIKIYPSIWKNFTLLRK
jgi:hypothetical protein